MIRFTCLVVVAIALVACGGQATSNSVTIAQAVQATLSAMPTSKPQAAEVTRIVEVTRIIERVVTSTPSPRPPTPTLTTQEAIVVGEPIVIGETSGGTKYLKILVILENPNTDWWMPMSHVAVSVFASGKIVGTDSSVIHIGPGEKAAYETSVDIGGEPYDEVQVDLSEKELRPSAIWPNAKVELVQANVVGDRIVGQIRNTGEVKIPQTKVIVLVRDATGKVVALDFSYAEESTPGQIVPFEHRCHGVTSIDAFELYLQPEIVEGTF